MNSTYFLLFIYLVLLALFHSSFDNFIYFVCQDAQDPAPAAAAAYPYPIAPIYAANGTEATSTEYRKK